MAASWNIKTIELDTKVQSVLENALQRTNFSITIDSDQHPRAKEGEFRSPQIKPASPKTPIARNLVAEIFGKHIPAP